MGLKGENKKHGGGVCCDAFLFVSLFWGLNGATATKTTQYKKLKNLSFR